MSDFPKCWEELKDEKRPLNSLQKYFFPIGFRHNAITFIPGNLYTTTLLLCALYLAQGQNLVCTHSSTDIHLKNTSKAEYAQHSTGPISTEWTYTCTHVHTHAHTHTHTRTHTKMTKNLLPTKHHLPAIFSQILSKFHFGSKTSM